jgi:Uma2 family endonuclease
MLLGVYLHWKRAVSWGIKASAVEPAAMTVPERRPRRFSPEEYLILERSADAKSEWIDGEIFAMGGGSPDHATIQANIYGELYRQLKGSNCRFYGSDMKVRSLVPPQPGCGLFTYPDATVVCGAPIFHDTESDVLVNPMVIFEVLSPATEKYDRGEKRTRYQSIASLTDCVLVAQKEPRIEHWVRNADETWGVSKLEHLGETLVLPSISCSIALSDIYDRISF